MSRTIPIDKCVYISRDPEIAEAIMSLMERKTGKKWEHKCAFTDYLYQVETADGISGNFELHRNTLMTLQELEALPDYEEFTEMTVAEISRELGKKIKVVEG